MIDFPAIASRRLLNTEKRHCPDQFVGTLPDIESAGDFTYRRDASERPDDLSFVLLILESPHKCEFKPAEDPGPAKGATGRNIRTHLMKALGGKALSGRGLILVNAVQFQCSLGLPTSEARDAVFREVWAAGGEEAFRKRIQKLYRDGDCVVNCCTRGNTKGDVLRDLVHRALVAALPPGTEVLRRTHPSSWRSAAHAAREWSPFS